MTTDVRPANPNDALFIADSQVRMAWETEEFRLDRETVTAGVHAVFEDRTKGRYWIAERNNRPVGCLLALPEWSDWRCGTVLWIHSLYVVPEFRRHGVFTALYSALRQQAVEDDDIKGLRLYVDHRNGAAKSTYRALGMDDNHYALYEWLAPEC